MNWHKYPTDDKNFELYGLQAEKFIGVSYHKLEDSEEFGIDFLENGRGRFIASAELNSVRGRTGRTMNLRKIVEELRNLDLTDETVPERVKYVVKNFLDIVNRM